MKESSELGYAPAMYALAVCHEMGELIEENKEAAAKLFKKSAEAGYPKAKISHGLNLYYGSNGIKMNKEQALNFLEDAQKDGIEGVNELLSELRNN